MPAYIIGKIEVTDWDRYREYVLHAPRVVRKFGGRFLSRGSAASMLEGPAETRRVVLLEFPTLQTAKDFWASDDYAKIKKLRDGAADAQFFVIDGYPIDEWQKAAQESELLSPPGDISEAGP
jgi:uncharacterized protein (DUF1330 family)